MRPRTPVLGWDTTLSQFGGDAAQRPTVASQPMNVGQDGRLSRVGNERPAVGIKVRSVGHLADTFGFASLVGHRGTGPLTDKISFELSQDRQHAEHHLSRRRCRVNSLRKRDQIGPGFFQPFGDGDRVTGRPREPTEAVHDQGATTDAHRVESRLETRAVVGPLPRNPRVDVYVTLVERPAIGGTPTLDPTPLRVETDTVGYLELG